MLNAARALTETRSPRGPRWLARFHRDMPCGRDIALESGLLLDSMHSTGPRLGIHRSCLYIQETSDVTGMAPHGSENPGARTPTEPHNRTLRFGGELVRNKTVESARYKHSARYASVPVCSLWVYARLVDVYRMR